MDLNPFTKFMGCPFFGKQKEEEDREKNRKQNRYKKT